MLIARRRRKDRNKTDKKKSVHKMNKDELALELSKEYKVPQETIGKMNGKNLKELLKKKRQKES